MAAVLVVLAAPTQAASGSLSLCLSPPPGTDLIEPCRAALGLDLPTLRARNVRLALARALTRVQRFAEAVEVYGDAVRMAPEDAESRLRLGEALLHLADKPLAAAEELQAALRLDPRSARAYGALGTALHALGEHAEAVAAFAEAARLDAEFFTNRPAAKEMDAASRRGTAWPAPAPQPASSGS